MDSKAINHGQCSTGKISKCVRQQIVQLEIIMSYQTEKKKKKGFYVLDQVVQSSAAWWDEWIIASLTKPLGSSGNQNRINKISLKIDK